MSANDPKRTSIGRPLLEPNVGDPNDLSPLFRFAGEKFTKLRGRTEECRTTLLNYSCFDFRISKSCVRRSVELVDNLRRGTFRSTNAKKGGCLITCHELAHSGNVRQRLRP